ncbi:MAG: AAA family ATPase [Deltaproteobacteria bacterium]|nr:AAA family ATPase [Deltaproteobacteria bacterium]
MKLTSLALENFGPFRSYKIPFAQGEHDCFLLTGKNNEGKSNIILALKLLSAATRSIGRNQFRQVIDNQAFYKLPQPDVESLRIGRLLHNYEGDRATIYGQFDNAFTITVVLDVPNDAIYADYDGRIMPGIENTFGVLPPLGPLAETEEFLTLKHVRSSITTSLAPRHLRNHFAQILTPEEYRMVQEIVGASWPSISLLPWERDLNDNTLKCFFKEKRIDREICWAGQGLQVWFQIVTHLVRFRRSSMVVLDEPEVNLHPEKQNDLIRLLREYHAGSVLVATHSVELMNNVNVSHILHVQKATKGPRVKSTLDRAYLEVVRSQIGSNFNLIASQFETFDRIVFTEDTSDYVILSNLARVLGLSIASFNIPVHGFSEYRKAIPFREAYRLLIGRDITYSMVLDRDYYPDAYLEKVKKELRDAGIQLILTPGKEIENMFLAPSMLKALIPSENRKEWLEFWETVFQNERLDCYGSFLTLHEKFCLPHVDTKTVTTKFTPVFDAKWNDPAHRHLFIGGKNALHKLRGFYRDHTSKSLTQQMLIDTTVRTTRHLVETFVKRVFIS